MGTYSDVFESISWSTLSRGYIFRNNRRYIVRLCYVSHLQVCIKENKECLKCVITVLVFLCVGIFLVCFFCKIQGNKSTCKKDGVFYKAGEKVRNSNAHNESPTSETKR